jgi:hypothetical protein
LALPCVPTTATVQGALGSGVTGNLLAANYNSANYNTGDNWWRLFSYNASTPGYVLPAIGDDVSVGTGYWIKSFDAPVGDGNLTVSGTATPAPVTTGEGCASANGCAAIEVTRVGGADRYNLVGNPFPYDVDWAKVRVRVKSGAAVIGVYTPCQAAGLESGAGCAGTPANPAVISNQIWIYNDTGTAYDTRTDISLPNPGNLKYFQSFWVKVFAVVLGTEGYTVELLIPAEASTHSQVTPAADSRFGAIARAVLDWLIPTAAADDAEGAGPGEDPSAQAGPLLEEMRALPSAALADPAFELRVSEGIWAEGRTPEEALATARAEALVAGREWYVLLSVAEPATGYRDDNSVLGQLLTAHDAYDPSDLIELRPFSTPFLTLVFPRPTWGERAGDYSSDFRRAQRLNARGRPVAGLPPGAWPFEIRVDRPGTKVVLRWAGEAGILRQSRLIDHTTGKTINPTARAYATTGYPVTLTTGTRAFTWRFLGQSAPAR